jgi:hypothetical protein
VSFPAVPSFAHYIFLGGSIAAVSSTNFIWQESGNGDPSYTTDGGNTWKQICISGVPCGTNSTSSVAIAGSGTKTFTVASCSNLLAGGSVTAIETADGNVFDMAGTVSSCTGTTLSISVSSSVGSGIFASWQIVPVTGWGANYTVWSMQVAADRVLPNTFYMYNYGPGGLASTPEGIYKSTDSGAGWTRVATRAFRSAVAGVMPRLKAVPNNSGHLFWTAGAVTSPPYPHTGTGLYRSFNGGSTWCNAGANGCGNAIGAYTIGETWDVGFGNACGGSYPVIFIFGWINNTGGVWRSKDNGATWTQLTDTYFNTVVAGTSNAGGGWIDQPGSIEGDANVCGRWYAGKKGTGWVFGQYNWVLERDLDPAGDNTPAWLCKAA